MKRLGMIALASLALAGCGGTQKPAAASPEEQTVRRVAEGYVEAIAGHQWARACASASAQVQADVQREAEQNGARATSCVSAWQALERKGIAVAGTASSVRIGDVSVRGDVATVEVLVMGSAHTSYAVREHGQWKLAEDRRGGSG